MTFIACKGQRGGGGLTLLLTEPQGQWPACYVRLITSVSTIGGGGDTTTLSPGRSPKQRLPRIRLHDPLDGRQACPKCNSYREGFGQISPREGLF